MSERKINLEKIIQNHIVHDYVDNDGDNMISAFKSDMIDSYKEFGKQLLEAAAENAKPDCKYVSDEWEMNRTMCHSVNKQSITDTINQVE